MQVQHLQIKIYWNILIKINCPTTNMLRIIKYNILKFACISILVQKLYYSSYVTRYVNSGLRLPNSPSPVDYIPNPGKFGGCRSNRVVRRTLNRVTEADRLRERLLIIIKLK